MITPVYNWMAEQVKARSPRAPVLEVGSLDINGSVRPLFPKPYVGLDMREGRGVDVMADIVHDGWYRASPDGERFNTVVSTETLEHVSNPWRAVERMYDALNPGGLCFIAVPWIFEYHPYPDDYWRISHAGLALMFEDAGFIEIECAFGGVETDKGLSHTFGKARRAW